MKRKLLMLMVALLSTYFGYSQAEIIVTAPSNTGSTTGLRAPNGTATHTTLRGVIIIPASELTGIPTSTIITKLGLLIASAGGPGPAGGTIQYYLQNTADVTNLKPTDWASIIAPMTSVYSGVFNLPTVAGPTADLTLTSSFTYTGGSLYVAYDYLGSTFTTSGWIYYANSTLVNGWRGLSDATTTPPANLTATSAFRPCFRLSFDNPFTNELSVLGIAGEKGIFNNTITTNQTVTSLISNTSQGDLTNVPVTLDVTGANPYSITQTIPTIAAGATSTLLFYNVPTISLGTQTLTISIPADENNTNNSRTFTQQVQCDTIGYAQTPVQSGAVGFNTGAGLIAVRHDIPNSITTYVTSISNYFPITANIAGNTMKGILLDGNGVILDSTAVITVTAGMLGTKQDFDFINGAIDVSGGVIYVGFRQNANTTTGYFPFANQNNSYVDPNAAATFGLNGGTPAPLGSGLGYIMIDATLTYGGFDVANSSNAGTVCLNSLLDIIPVAGYTNYEFFIDGSSVQNGATSTYTTMPLTADIEFNVNITNGTCLLNSNLQTITVVSAIVNNISADICQGQSYTFGSQTLNTGGVFSDTLTSISGCDSVVTLNLTINTVDVGVTDNSPTLTANAAGASYQWLDCNNSYAVIASEIGQSFTATVNGSYAVEITQNGCMDTTVCTSIINVGIVENNFGDGFVVSPNPTNGNFSIDLGSNYENAQITITDISGKLIESKIIAQSQVLNLSIEEPAGIYMVSIQAGDKRAVIQLVKE